MNQEEGGNNSMKRKIQIVVFAPLLLLCACNGSQEKPKEVNQDPQTYEEPSYTPQYPSTYTPQPSNDVQEQIEPARVEPIASVKISKEYQEGYDAGYDDGEDDAISRNGYEGQYDDACRYKGQKRKDYQLGYAEGYEAGFYDNVSDNGDDEEYE